MSEIDYEEILREVPRDIDGSSVLEIHEAIKENEDMYVCSPAILKTLGEFLDQVAITAVERPDGFFQIPKNACTHRALNNARIRFYDLTRWIDLLDGHTFRSHLFTMSKPTLCALAAAVDSGDQLSQAPLQELMQSLGSVMDGQTKWFVKLASVSPKDLDRELSARTPTQVLRLLCDSKRTGDVIQSAAKNSMVDGQHNTVVLREFYPCDYRFEFRMFVYHWKVTAISQYIWNEAFDVLADNSEMLMWKQEMITYWEDVLQPALRSTGVDRWIVDVLRRPDSSYIAIEINAFGADLRTGGCLFHWQLDYDVIHGDGKQCQLRLCSGGSIESGFLVIRIL